jgi:hypothetical protein
MSSSDCGLHFLRVSTVYPSPPPPQIVWGWKQTQFAKHYVVWFLEYQTMDKVQKLTNSEIQYYFLCRSALLTLREQHFPQLSTELHSGSLEYSSFVNAFHKILRGLEESGSCAILLSVVAMTASESQHVLEDRIQQSLQTFLKRYCQII